MAWVSPILSTMYLLKRVEIEFMWHQQLQRARGSPSTETGLCFSVAVHFVLIMFVVSSTWQLVCFGKCQHMHRVVYNCSH